jgi:hypothetical protein
VSRCGRHPPSVTRHLGEERYRGRDTSLVKSDGLATREVDLKRSVVRD